MRATAIHRPAQARPQLPDANGQTFEQREPHIVPGPGVEAAITGEIMTTVEIGRTVTLTKAVHSGKPSAEPNGTSTFDQVVSDFLKEAKKTPMERLRERILKSHHLSEQQFDALPKEEKAAILREIGEAVKRSTKGVASGTAATGDGANFLG